MGKTRSSLYKAARILGDIEAVSKGRVGKRIQRRVAGKMTGRALRGSGCFIATACYESRMADEVLLLSCFRDQCLEKFAFTRVLISVYYAVSPCMASLIRKHSILKKCTRLILLPLACLLKALELQASPKSGSCSSFGRDRDSDVKDDYQ